MSDILLRITAPELKYMVSGYNTTAAAEL